MGTGAGSLPSLADALSAPRHTGSFGLVVVAVVVTASSSMSLAFPEVVATSSSSSLLSACCHVGVKNTAHICRWGFVCVCVYHKQDDKVKSAGRERQRKRFGQLRHGWGTWCRTSSRLFMTQRNENLGWLLCCSRWDKQDVSAGFLAEPHWMQSIVMLQGVWNILVFTISSDQSTGARPWYPPCPLLTHSDESPLLPRLFENQVQQRS